MFFPFPSILGHDSQDFFAFEGVDFLPTKPKLFATLSSPASFGYSTFGSKFAVIGCAADLLKANRS